jgi:hypothetical protein
VWWHGVISPETFKVIVRSIIELALDEGVVSERVVGAGGGATTPLHELEPAGPGMF